MVNHAILAAVPAATENLNPSGSGCWISKAPRGCEADPDTPCERGQDIGGYELVVGLLLISIYFVFPPILVILTHRWIKKSGLKVEGSSGLQKIRASAKKEMMWSVGKQISAYLLSFWLTWIFSLAHAAYQILSSGEILYDLQIFANCMYASQGFVFAFVYFIVDRMGKPKVNCLPSSDAGPGARRQLTVMDIRLSAQRKPEISPEMGSSSRRSNSILFNIFDGVPDEDSPWAKYLNGEYGDDSDEEDAQVDSDD